MRTRKSVLALTVSAVLVGLAPLPTGTAAAAPAGPGCHVWTKTRIASGLGVLENLGFDRRGGLLISAGKASGAGALLRMTPDGATTPLVPNVTGPGGIVVDGSSAYFTTGNTLTAGFLGTPNGTVDRVDLDTGARTTVARGLTMPNGMIAAPDGGFLVSRDLGRSTRMTEVRADGTLATYAPKVTSTNGMAYDAAAHRLYVASTFNPTTTISVVDTLDPSATPRVIKLPGIGPLNAADDLTLGADGFVYVALNLVGQVVRVDPDTGRLCTVGRGLPLSSSLRFGAGAGWDAGSLYVTSFRGFVTKLTP